MIASQKPTCSSCMRDGGGGNYFPRRLGTLKQGKDASLVPSNGKASLKREAATV